jgi:uncharacterized Rmd1/YagE family protein
MDMNVSALCTATSYTIKPLFGELQNRYPVTMYRDVIHAVVPYNGIQIDAFIFPYGAMVLWNISSDEKIPFVDEIREFEYGQVERVEVDDFTFGYGDKTSFLDDHITLPDHEILTKVAISHGIAQSVKLGAFEFTISKTFEKNKHIPENLAKRGKIPLSRKEIRKKMGELFLERSYVNLHVDVLDTPEFFWEYPELEPFYLMVATELDIEDRGIILNQRLDVVKELFGMLNDELNHQHSSRLELTIVILIVIEVVISLSVNFLK